MAGGLRIVCPNSSQIFEMDPTAGRDVSPPVVCFYVV